MLKSERVGGAVGVACGDTSERTSFDYFMSVGLGYLITVGQIELVVGDLLSRFLKSTRPLG